MTPEARTVLQAFVSSPSAETWETVRSEFWPWEDWNKPAKERNKFYIAFQCHEKYHRDARWYCDECKLYGICHTLHYSVHKSCTSPADLAAAHCVVVQILAADPEEEKGG